MNRILILAVTAVVVALAGPAASHAFPNDDPYEPGDHECTGTADWGDVRWVTRVMVNGDDLTLWIDPPPHGEPTSQDPTFGATSVRQPGVVWMEANGLQGLQKADYSCVSTDGAHDDEAFAHSDSVVL